MELPSLGLYFSEDAEPELYKTEFSVPHLGVFCRAIRGRGTDPSCGSFQWSQAVRAFALLALATATVERTQCCSLSGGKGSAAASLDFALGKLPLWVLDMFGSDSGGNSIARRLIHRGNPELRRRGPARLTLNTRFLPGSAIRIFIGNTPADSAAELGVLCAHLEQDLSCELIREPRQADLNTVRTRESSRAVQATISSDESADASTLLEILEASYAAEASSMLERTPVLNRSRLSSLLKSHAEHPVIRSIGGKQADVFQGLARSPDTSTRLGLISNVERLRALVGVEPITVELSIILSGAVVLFEYVRREHALPIELSLGNAHTIDILYKLRSAPSTSRPQLACLALGPSAALMSELEACRYRAVSPLPMLRHELSASKAACKQIRNGNNRVAVGHVNIPYSTSSVYLHSLNAANILDPTKSASEDISADEAFCRLLDGDPQFVAVVPFPFFRVNSLLLNCDEFTTNTQWSAHTSFLFTDMDFHQDSPRYSALELLLRDAWIRLRENPGLVREVTRSLFEKSDFQTALARTSGLTAAGISLHSTNERVVSLNA